MASAKYSFIQTFSNKVGDPDIFDYVGSPVAGADTLFSQLGQIAKRIQDKTLRPADADFVRATLKVFSDGINRLSDRISQSGNVVGNSQDKKFAQYFKSMKVQIDLAMRQVTYAADEIAAGNSASIQKLLGGASGVLKQVGGLLGLMQIGKEFYDNGFTDIGVDKAGEKSIGLIAGLAGGEIAAALVGGAAVAIGAPVLLSAAVVIVFAVGAGYLAGKAGESVWEPVRDWGKDFFSQVFDKGSDALTLVNTNLDDLTVKMGRFNGTWLEGLDATDTQKAAFTTLLAGVSHLPASKQMNADIKRLLEAPFDASALLPRDVLIRAVLLVSQEQNAYVSERVTVSNGAVVFDLPPGGTQALASIREFARKSLSEFDQAGFSIRGGSRIIVSTASITVAGDARNELLIGTAGTDGLIGNAGNDELLAGAGDDVLRGGDGIDVLFGGTGNDFLSGGTGTDYLYGGDGLDTYKFFAGETGSDWIVDSDGKGKIEIENIGFITGEGAKKIADRLWQTDDKKVVYELVMVDGAQTDLVISVNGQPQIKIRGWSPAKNLGITLTDTLFVPTAGVVVAGTVANDTLHTTTPSSTLLGLAGNDALDGGTGGDVLNGADGSDVLAGGAGNDTLEGGDGTDYIFGSSTYGGTGFNTKLGDWVSSSGPAWTISGVSAPLAGDATNVIDAGNGDDWVAAGTGSDVVHAGLGNDRVYGMGGNDVIDGDAGNDDLHGDASVGNTASSYIYAPATSHGNDVLSGGSGNDTLTGYGGADDLYGGADNDVLVGDSDVASTPAEVQGDDYLDGGDGNDQLIGGGRDDQLFGGSGADTLSGDDVAANVPGAAPRQRLPRW